jgi:hypothetical protein
VHEKLAALQAAQAPQAAPQPAQAAEKAPLADSTQAVAAPVVEPAVAVEPIPRFALQLLRAGSCLLLADLPVGEPFQSRDPDYQLLRDMLRAAELSDQPSFLRQGAPIRWPLLQSGNLMQEQNAVAARSCVRDLLTVELAAEPTVCIWLLGEQAVRFASADEQSAQLYALQPFVEGVQLWSLPSLEDILQQARYLAQHVSGALVMAGTKEWLKSSFALCRQRILRACWRSSNKPFPTPGVASCMWMR